MGTKIFSLFKYSNAMHTPKINAEKMLPKLWRDANNIDETNIAKTGGTINFSLFNRTPLKINSSAKGETKTIEIKLKIPKIDLMEIKNLK